MRLVANVAKLACPHRSIESVMGATGPAFSHASLLLFYPPTSRVFHMCHINFWTFMQVQSRYYPLAERFLKELTGASRVHVFDNTVRHGHIK